MAGHLDREAELAQAQADSARAHAATARTRMLMASSVGPTGLGPLIGRLDSGTTGGAG